MRSNLACGRVFLRGMVVLPGFVRPSRSSEKRMLPGFPCLRIRGALLAASEAGESWAQTKIARVGILTVDAATSEREKGHGW